MPNLIPYFWPIFASFQNEADCLSINSLIDRDWKWLFFYVMIRILLSNPSQIFKINAVVSLREGGGGEGKG